MKRGGRPHDHIPTPPGGQDALREHAVKEIPLRGLLLDRALASGKSSPRGAGVLCPKTFGRSSTAASINISSATPQIRCRVVQRMGDTSRCVADLHLHGHSGPMQPQCLPFEFQIALQHPVASRNEPAPDPQPVVPAGSIAQFVANKIDRAAVVGAGAAPVRRFDIKFIGKQVYRGAVRFRRGSLTSEGVRQNPAPPSRRSVDGPNYFSTQATAYLRATPPPRRENCATVVEQSGKQRWVSNQSMWETTRVLRAASCARRCRAAPASSRHRDGSGSAPGLHRASLGS